MQVIEKIDGYVEPSIGSILLGAPGDLLRELLIDEKTCEAGDYGALPESVRLDVRVALLSGVEPFGRDAMEAFPNLEAIVTVGAGFDGVDESAAAARNIVIQSGSGANADDVADGALALFLALARGVLTGDAMVRRGAWKSRVLRPVKSVGSMQVGIVGLGNIGVAIARRLCPLRCGVRWTGPRPKEDAEWPYVPDLLDLAAQCDAMIVTAPLNAQTRGMIDINVMRALGPNGLLVNVGRGGVVREDDLIAALGSGELGGAALDVFEVEPTAHARWSQAPNLVLSPHAAGITYEALEAVFRLAASRAIEWLKTPPPGGAAFASSLHS